jgi:hypothetical protein
MPPAPATIAAPPMMKSVASWIPAVPPPPVAGAAVGGGADAWAADGVCVGVGVGVGVDVGVGVGVPLSFAGRLTGALDVAEVSGSEDEADAPGGVDPEQAAIAAQASTAMAPRPMTLNIALTPVPAMVPKVVRSFMEPPHAPRRCEGKAHGRHRHTMT